MRRGTLRSETPEPAAAITAEDFARLMEPFAPHPKHYALAISGGPDSMALVVLMRDWAATNSVQLTAFIVDHRLRPESTAEAAATHKNLQSFNIPAEILPWDHPPIISRLHIAARKARYKLLTEACRRHSIQHLLLAHQREDQAETVLMRLAKGTGIDGLAGIPRHSIAGGIHLLRPLLDVPKEKLIATCEASNISFITDPSNQSEKYARGRLRRVLPLLTEEGLTIERLVDLGERAAETKEALDHYTAAFLRTATQRSPADVIQIDVEQLRSTPRAIAGRALALCLKNFQADDYMPARISLMSLLDALCADQDRPPRTLQGCLVSRSSQHITILREFSAITDTPRIVPGDSVIWDGRWHITFNQNMKSEGYHIAPLGNPTHESVDNFAPNLRQKLPHGRARASLPALWHNDILAGIPVFEGLADYPSLTHARLHTAWPPAPR